MQALLQGAETSKIKTTSSWLNVCWHFTGMLSYPASFTILWNDMWVSRTTSVIGLCVSWLSSLSVTFTCVPRYCSWLHGSALSHKICWNSMISDHLPKLSKWDLLHVLDKHKPLFLTIIGFHCSTIYQHTEKHSLSCFERVIFFGSCMVSSHKSQSYSCTYQKCYWRSPICAEVIIRLRS